VREREREGERIVGDDVAWRQFCFAGLEHLCRAYILAHINAVNVWETWLASVKVYQDVVVDACHTFAVDHASEVFASPSITEASEDLLLAVLGDEQTCCSEIEVCTVSVVALSVCNTCVSSDVPRCVGVG
jgi:hypothetical protein